MSYQLEGLKRLMRDFPTYAEKCLMIMDKQGRMTRFSMNRAQHHIHECLETQLAEMSLVRALLLKGRQQGGSTYIGGRFYHKTSMTPGRRAFIVAHEQKATDNLYSMVKRYHENNPLAPSTGVTNAKELIFSGIDSGYKLATAGSKDVGRSNTVQLMHGSEFAFWQNAKLHLAGIGNTIADLPGTEIVLESTANGQGNPFHELWLEAEAGRGLYIPIFVPWFWQDEYTAPVPKDFDMSPDDEAYMQAFGLSLGQMAWRANKLVQYGIGFEWLFDQEYPATPAMAFKSATKDPLITPVSVMASVNSGYSHRGNAPLIIGCDPAEEGDDSTVIAFRQGRVAYRIEGYEKKRPMEVAGILANHYHEYKPDAICVDKIGIGAGIVDRLRELNIPVVPVNSAERAEDSERYANKRAEMWYRMKEWLEDLPSRIPNHPRLISDLSMPGYKARSNGQRLIQSKKELPRSPDYADALAMTFSENIAPKNSLEQRHIRHTSPPRKAATVAGY